MSPKLTVKQPTVFFESRLLLRIIFEGFFFRCEYLQVLLLVALLAVVHTSPLSAKASDRYDEDLELEEFEDEFTVEEMNEVDEDTMIELFGDEAEEPSTFCFLMAACRMSYG